MFVAQAFRLVLLLLGAAGSLALPMNSFAETKESIVVNRHVELPPFSIWKNGDSQHQEVHKYDQSRFTVVLAIASWSARSLELANYFHSRLEELRRRRVNVVAAFTHDSVADIKKIIKANRYDFLVSKTSLRFVTEMLNPKIPTIWVADHTGQIVHQLVRPTTEGMEQTYKYLRSWTDF